MAIIKFLVAMSQWVGGGFKCLPQAFIDWRWSACNDCEYKKVGCVRTQCTLCKCTVNNKRNPFNKLAHGSQECPIKKWSKVHDIGN